MIHIGDARSIDLDALARLRARCNFAAKPTAFLQAQLDGSRWIVLHTRPDAAAFYAALGFADATDMMVRERG